MPGTVRAVATLAIVLALVGCEARDPPRTALTFWVIGREGPEVAVLLDEFERRNPDLDVEVLALPWTAAHAKLLTAHAANALPDVFQLGNTWMAEFVALDALAPLDERVAGSAHVAVDDYFPGMLDTNRMHGVLFGLPWNVDTRVLFYRRDLLAALGFDAPPQTWAQWQAMLAAAEPQHALLMPIGEVEPLLVFALQQGEPLLRDDDRYGNFRSAGFRRALRLYARLFADDRAPRLHSTQIANAWVEFGQGGFVFYLSGAWNVAEFRDHLPPALRDAWATAPLPGPHGPGASLAGGSSMVLNARGAHRDAAWRLMEYLAEPRIQRQLYRALGSLPSRRSSWEHPDLANDAHLQAFRRQLEHVEPMPRIAEWERIAQEVRQVSEQVAAGQIDVDDAAILLDQRADAILEKRRWMLDRARPPNAPTRDPASTSSK